MALIRDLGDQDQDFKRSRSTIKWPGSEVNCSGSEPDWEAVSGQGQIADPLAAHR